MQRTDQGDNELRRQALLSQMGGPVGQGVSERSPGDDPNLGGYAMQSLKGAGQPLPGGAQIRTAPSPQTQLALGMGQSTGLENAVNAIKDMTGRGGMVPAGDDLPSAGGFSGLGQAAQAYGLAHPKGSIAASPTQPVLDQSGAVAAPAPAAKQYKLEGFDAGKLADPTHNTPKYMIARALQGFDPRQGVTPEVLQALNQLGIGQFSGSGDKVQIANGDPRFEGVNAIDLVRGFKDPNSDGGWQFGAEGGVAGQGAPAQAGGLNGLLTGNPLAGIQAAIGQYGGESANLQALLRQLQQGA